MADPSELGNNEKYTHTHIPVSGMGRKLIHLL
jgi:hypothetical protein